MSNWCLLYGYINTNVIKQVARQINPSIQSTIKLKDIPRGLNNFIKLSKINFHLITLLKDEL